MPAPLFLLAPPRSYTSLINAMLGQHPQAFGLPELCLFNVEILGQLWVRNSDEMGSEAKTRHGLLRAVAEIYAGEQTMHSVRMAEHWCQARQHLGTGAVYRELVETIDPLVTVEKSPAYTVDIKRLRAIRRAFPEGRFLHLTRHPMGQCKSVMSLYDGTFALFVNSIEFGADRAFVEPQYAWHDFNVNILNFLDSVPPAQQMRLRGEDMMNDPPRYLVDICRWLGLRTDTDAIEEMMHPERSPFACFGPLDALFGNDPNFLSGPSFHPHKVKMPSLDEPVPWREDGASLKPEVVALAKELGY
jgi:hypothetical protein